MTKKPKLRYEGAYPFAILPYICTIGIALMYTICNSQVWICSAIMCVCTCAVFLGVYKMQTLKIGVRLIALAMSLIFGGAIIIVAISFMEYVTGADPTKSQIRAIGEFIDFIFTASKSFDPVNAAIAIIVFSVIIGFVCCYFSVILPRIGFLLLPAFIPLILASRTAGGLPLWIVVPMFGCFVLAVCCSARPAENPDVPVFYENSSSKERIIAASCLAVAAAVISFLVPKSDQTLFGSVLDEVFTNGKGGFFGRAIISNFASQSSVNTGNNQPDDEVLFTVQTHTPENLDRWSFDIYNGKQGWSYLKDYNTGYPEWENYARKRNWTELFGLLIKAAEDGQLEDYTEVLSGLPVYSDVEGLMYVNVSDTTPSSVIMHPIGTSSVEIKRFDGKTYRTPKGELFTEGNISAPKYLISYNVQMPSGEYAKAMESVDFLALLNTAADLEIIDGATANAFSDEYRRAQDYRISTGTDGISAEILMLAAEITNECKTDYERACAIEKWFGDNDFYYDLDFVPASTEAEYFLFDSRRGICSDYATAVTLLARACGLPARYTEGFSLNEDSLSDSGIYEVTAANAHAYTQIYITGCGWVNFDATRWVKEADPNNISQEMMIVIYICAGVILIIGVLAIIFREPLGWALFSATYRMRSKESRVKAVFHKARQYACAISGSNILSTSAGEAEQILSNTLSLPEDAATIRKAADELMYSDTDSTADTMELYRCLSRIRSRKRGLKK